MALSGGSGSNPLTTTNGRLVQLANGETLYKTRSNKTITKRTSSHTQWCIEENDGSTPSPITKRIIKS